MSSPLKNVSVQELEKALEAALLSVSGKTVKVEINTMEFEGMAGRVDLSFSAWDKLDGDWTNRAI